jgi:hypothetical protein
MTTPGRLTDRLLTVAGTVIGLWGGFLLAIYTMFITPYRIGTVLIPLSIVLAIAGNAALIWFTYTATGNKWLGLLPGLVWVALTFFGADRTTEGDLVLSQRNWVATVYLFAGAATVGIAAYRLIVPKPPPLTPRR